MSGIEAKSKEPQVAVKAAQSPADYPNPPSSFTELSKFSKFSVITIIFTLLVVAWGVYVRASKDGDGCGSHWPLCDGNSNPIHGTIARIVESSHRLSTSLLGLFVVVLTIWSIRKYGFRAQVTKASLAAFFFMLLEGAIGAVLVKFQLVTNNPSANRAAVMSFHVISTFLLVGSMVATCYLSIFPKVRFKKQGAVGWMLALGFILTCGLGVSGAISALGHTLDPVKDVLLAASNPTTFWMVRFQPYHPYISISVWMYFILMVTLVTNLRPLKRVRTAGIWLLGAFTVELCVGLLNILTKAPIAVQMIHLALGDAMVVTLTWFILSACQEGATQRERLTDAHEDVPEGAANPTLTGVAKQYLALTKPRVISLLLVTTATAMFAAANGWPGLAPLLMVLLGGYMAAGSANTINMVVERDLDYAMKRTRVRPTVTDSIPAAKALGFALILGFGAFAIISAFGSLLAAIFAEAGLVFYVSIYTLWLKRRTWQNIVIGGAAGAFPPLVGWAAVTGHISPLPLYLFAIVFLWTPVHFWALAILIKDDYEAAGVPMLPVIKGNQVTSHQIAVYCAFTVAVSLAPLAVRLVGWPYGISAVALNGYLVALCVKLVKNPERPQASGLFHYSMLYLALLFCAIAMDRSFGHGMLAQPGVKSLPVQSSARGNWAPETLSRKTEASALLQRHLPSNNAELPDSVRFSTISSSNRND